MACPVSFRYVNKHAVRLGAFVMTCATLMLLIDPTSIVASVIVLWMCIDFALRFLGFNRLSLTARLGEFLIKRMVRVNPLMVDEAPIKVAQAFGLTMSITLAIFVGLEVWWGVYVLGAVLLTCTLLEAFVGLCLGCKIYFLYRRLFV